MTAKISLAVAAAGTLAAMGLEQYLLGGLGALASCVVFLFGLVWRNFQKCEADREALRGDIRRLYEYVANFRSISCDDRKCPAKKFHQHNKLEPPGSHPP